MEEKRILIIDDDFAVRSLLRIRLENNGFVVMTAQNGWEGLTTLAHEEVHVVLLDYQMPGIDGLTVLNFMQQFFPAVPVVMMSGSGDELAPQALRAGAQACLSKPFQRGELDEALQSCVETARSASSLIAAH